MPQINNTAARIEKLQLIKNSKDRYLILFDYGQNKKGNIREKTASMILMAPDSDIPRL